MALVALVLVSFCLRGPVASVGPVLQEIRDTRHLGATAVAFLPTLPLLVWGVLSVLTPGLSRRLGLHRAVLAALGVLVVGLLVRGVGATGLFVGTVLLAAGIAIINVLMPAVLKADFADRLALATGLSTAGIALSSTVGAGLAQPLDDLTGGPLRSLGLWVVPVGVALLVWLPVAVRRRRDPAPPGPHRLGLLLRDPVAIAVTVFFGLQSLTFYTMLAWLPSILRSAGVSAGTAGTMLAAATLLGAPAAIVIPRLAVSTVDQVRWVMIVSVPNVVGLLGLLIVPSQAPWVWALLLGLGTGSSFPLALTLVLLRAVDSAQATRLSAVAQGVGYGLAAGGPLAVGLLHSATNSWRPSLVLLLALVGVQVVVGAAAGRNRSVTG